MTSQEAEQQQLADLEAAWDMDAYEDPDEPCFDCWRNGETVPAVTIIRSAASCTCRPWGHYPICHNPGAGIVSLTGTCSECGAPWRILSIRLVRRST